MPVTTVNEYLQAVPAQSQAYLDQLRAIVKAEAPEATEVISYGILGYKLPQINRAFAYVSGFTNHVSIYPIPANVPANIAIAIKPYIAGKGTLKFKLDQPLPQELAQKVIQALYRQAKVGP